MSPNSALGIPLMDEDHAHLEELLQAAAKAGDRALPAVFTNVENEIRAHFAREEDLMRARGVPILACHMIQHQLFLAHFSEGHEAAERQDMTALRYFIVSTLPDLLSNHVNTADRMTALQLISTRSATAPADPVQMPLEHAI